MQIEELATEHLADRDVLDQRVVGKCAAGDGTPEQRMPDAAEVARQLADDHDVILVSHGAAIRVVTKHATGVDADFAYTGYLPNCRFMVMEPRGKDFGQWALTRWADTEL